jgi:ABC-2 type transport system ATP-binding protein
MHSTKGKEMHLTEPTINHRRPELRSIDGLGEWAGTPAVEVSQLRKTYPSGVEAVKGIDFEVAPGEVFGLLGPNGAGKSTTIGMLTTTVRPTSGSARLAGYDVATQPLLARSVSSVVFQDAVVDAALSGRSNLELHARLWAVPATQANRRIAELVEAVGLAELIERPVSSYSGGQRRRLEIARALVSAPRVLFLDEPTVGLDPRIRHELLDVIVGLRNREDMTILVTTHYLDEAQRLCDRVAIIHQGEIVALDSPHALLAGLGQEILEFRVDGSPAAAVEALRDRGVARGDSFAIGARVTVPLHEHAATEAIAAIEAESLRVSEIATRIPTLDDVYLQLTGARMDEAA